jgi:hypothetical protein
MCLTLMFKVFGTTLFFQGCMTSEPMSLPQKVDPPTPPVTIEEWAPMVAKADLDDDGSITYLFRDAGGRVRPAVASCGDTMPKEMDGKVMIAQIKHKSFTVYTVSCTEPPKIM